MSHLPQRADDQPADIVLIVCSELSRTVSLAEAVREAGLHPVTVSCAAPQAEIPAPGKIAVCLLADSDSHHVTQVGFGDLLQQNPAVQVVRLIDARSVESVQMVADGNFVEWPCSSLTLGTILHSAVRTARMTRERQQLRQVVSRIRQQSVIGYSQHAQRMRDQIEELARTDCNVLITGQSEYGADTAARSIHLWSNVADRPFLAIDCRVYSSEALARELFGTGSADENSPESVDRGRLAEAAGGTLLLTHVDAIALPLQKTLANALQRSHGEDTGSEPVRVIATSTVEPTSIASSDLLDARFLDVLAQRRLQLIPLRDRPEDIGTAAAHFLRELAIDEGRPIRRIARSALDVLMQHEWPGDLDELRNVLERACAVTGASRLTDELVRPWLEQVTPDSSPRDYGLTVREMERKLIETTFARFQGNREQTASQLQIGLRTLSGKLREYGYPPRGGPGSNRVAVHEEPTLSEEPTVPTRKAA